MAALGTCEHTKEPNQRPGSAHELSGEPTALGVPTSLGALLWPQAQAFWPSEAARARRVLRIQTAAAALLQVVADFESQQILLHAHSHSWCEAC